MGKDRAWDTDGTDQMVAEVDTGYTAPGLLPAPVHEAMLVGLWEQLPQSVLEKEVGRCVCRGCSVEAGRLLCGRTNCTPASHRLSHWLSCRPPADD